MQVTLYIYDLSQGMAKTFAPMFQLSIEAIYHTSIVMNGTEYYFGQGVHASPTPGRTVYGSPIRTMPLGTTFVDLGTFHDYLAELSSTKYT